MLFAVFEPLKVLNKVRVSVKSKFLVLMARGLSLIAGPLNKLFVNPFRHGLLKLMVRRSFMDNWPWMLTPLVVVGRLKQF